MNNPQYKPGERVEIIVSRGESDFDRACDSAQYLACGRFGVDDCGHINNVEGAHRSCSSIEVEFKTARLSAGMGGSSWTYVFEAWVEVVDEDEEY
jgi:hypothetical protein